nr:CD63/His-tag fusion protein [synthetic construct]
MGVGAQLVLSQTIIQGATPGSGGGGSGYVFRDKVMSEFNNNFRQQMENYPKNNHTASILDRMQADFKCCGAANYTDWEKIPSMSKNRVPDSCCINVTVGCGINFNEKAIHKEGCVEKIGGWLRKNVLEHHHHHH